MRLTATASSGLDSEVRYSPARQGGDRTGVILRLGSLPRWRRAQGSGKAQRPRCGGLQAAAAAGWARSPGTPSMAALDLECAETQPHAVAARRRPDQAIQKYGQLGAPVSTDHHSAG